MVSMILAMAALMLSPAADNEIGRRESVQLIDAAQPATQRDVSFDYEGKWIVPSRPEQEQVEQVYNGSFGHRDDGAALIDLYHTEPQSKVATHDVAAILKGTTSTSSRRAGQKAASIGVKKQGPLEYAGVGNFRQIWLVDLVRNYADSSYVYEYEGMRQLDGAECIVVRFRLVEADDIVARNKTVSKIFWVDLNRGGHVVRHETRVEGENLSELTTIQLQQFEPQPGRMVWLPASGRFETFVKTKNFKQRIYVNEPVLIANYLLLPLTLRIDRGLKDDFFSVRPRNGDVVSDQIRKAQYEFGQYMIRPATATRNPTDAEVGAGLDRMLKDSKVMAKELKASSPHQEGSVWWSLWPWAVAGVAVLVGGVLYYRQRQG